MNRAKIKESLRELEGFREAAYYDTLGVPSIGFGCTFYRTGTYKGDKVTIADTITRERAEQELDAALDDCVAEIAKHPATREVMVHLPEPAYQALVEMAYQLGVPRLAKFKKMLLALQRGRYTRAAAEAMDSRWCKQTPARVLHVVKLFAEAAGE